MAHPAVQRDELLPSRQASPLQPLQLPTSTPIAASATTAIEAEFNVDARAVIWDSVLPNIPLTTYGTSVTTYDSQGTPIEQPMYMRKTANDTWEVFTDPTDATTAAATVAATLTFSVNGQLLSTVPAVPTGSFLNNLANSIARGGT